MLRPVTSFRPITQLILRLSRKKGATKLTSCESPNSRALVFANDSIGILSLGDESGEYFAGLGVKTIADLVANLGKGGREPWASICVSTHCVMRA